MKKTVILEFFYIFIALIMGFVFADYSAENDRYLHLLVLITITFFGYLLLKIIDNKIEKRLKKEKNGR